ncbi:AraC family transcriptional regulator [Caulobacter sp. KR2-114]|uniref:AraC family transcriptional regulator n=1 Tax=Caulobacter sp. KR2-114 TaxID=3400912 RepID=UPI003C123039
MISGTGLRSVNHEVDGWIEAGQSQLSNRDSDFASGDSRADTKLPRFIRSGLLAAYRDAAKSVGLEPTLMLRRANLPQDPQLDPDTSVPEDRVRTLLSNSAAAAQRDDFGLLVGLSFRLSMKGPLGLLVKEQPTVRKAIDVLARYMSQQTNTVDIQVEEFDGALVFMPVLLSPRSRTDRQMIDFTIARYVQVFRALLGEAWMPQLVGLSHAAPADPGPYHRQFGRVVFDLPQSSIVLTASDAYRAIPNVDPDMARELTRLVERGRTGAAIELKDRVAELIARLLPGGDCSVDQVAEHLGVDRRTIHRRLAAEGSSFSELLEETRRQMAQLHLTSTDYPLGDVAHRLGFSSLSTFSRWFRGAFGVTARDYRQGVHH